MKTLYLECKMGAAGDMLTAALLGVVDANEFMEKMNTLGLPHTEIIAKNVSKCGISGMQVSVRVNGVEENSMDIYTHGHEAGNHSDHVHTHEQEEHCGHGHTHEAEKHYDHVHTHEQEEHCEHGNHRHVHGDEKQSHSENHHSHTSRKEIGRLINGLSLSQKVRDDALAVYDLLAEAESKAHGRAVEEIHFHEVGTLDAVADIVGVCLLMEMIAPDRVIVSDVNVGSGMVHCAHGILPVPTPATAYLLSGLPMYGSEVQGELCTPTGAALLKYFADDFGDMPVMKTDKIGYGFGKKEFASLNCVRAFLSEDEQMTDSVIELKCNLDDMLPEDIGFATEKLWEAGALDVYTSPVYMKKNRPAILLTVLCYESKRDQLVKEIFRYTSTIGIRQSICERFVLKRSEEVCHTECGDIRIKSVNGYGVERSKPEYEDIARLAKEQGVSPAEVRAKYL